MTAFHKVAEIATAPRIAHYTFTDQPVIKHTTTTRLTNKLNKTNVMVQPALLTEAPAFKIHEYSYTLSQNLAIQSHFDLPEFSPHLHNVTALFNTILPSTSCFNVHVLFMVSSLKFFIYVFLISPCLLRIIFDSLFVTISGELKVIPWLQSASEL
jgi:hypothetical protein